MTVRDSNLKRVAAKLAAQERLDLEDGITCLTTPDLLGLGRLAHAEKLKRYGRRVTYVFNRQVNPTNPEQASIIGNGRYDSALWVGGAGVAWIY